MSIRLAMSTQACPEWPVVQAIQQAGAMGYQGIELITHFGPDTPRYACDAQQGDAQAIARQLGDAGVEAVCLTTNIALSWVDESQGRAAMRQVRDAIERAAALGCPAVRVVAHRVAGEPPRATLSRAAERARALADFASSHGVQILFENNADFPTARDWWWCMDIARNPMVGLAWHIEPSGLEGEGHAISVPMLHSRLRLVKISDVKLGPEPEPVALGEGDFQIKPLIHRLMGVGYDGFLSVTWDRLHRPWLAPAADVLPAACQQLKDWQTAIAEAAEPKKPARGVRPATLPGVAASKTTPKGKQDDPTPARAARQAHPAKDKPSPPVQGDDQATPDQPTTDKPAVVSKPADKPASSLRAAALARIAAAKAAKAKADADQQAANVKDDARDDAKGTGDQSADADRQAGA